MLKVCLLSVTWCSDIVTVKFCCFKTRLKYALPEYIMATCFSVIVACFFFCDFTFVLTVYIEVEDLS